MDWDSEYIAGLIERALAEDVGAGDATVAATILTHASGEARILAKQELVCAGLPLVERIFRRLDLQMAVDFYLRQSTCEARRRAGAPIWQGSGNPDW
jgi:nicotinate-nucleotide pyrophosphorylase